MPTAPKPTSILARSMQASGTLWRQKPRTALPCGCSRPSSLPTSIWLTCIASTTARTRRCRRCVRPWTVDPRNGAAYHALGLSLVRQQRLRDALPTLAQAAQLRPDLPHYAYVYGVALHEAGEGQRALQVLAAAYAQHPAARDIVVALVEYSLQARDRPGALAWARKLVELAPDDSRARQLLESLERRP